MTVAHVAGGGARSDTEPVSNESLHRTVTGLITVVPILALGLVAWQAWGSALRLSDVKRAHLVSDVVRIAPERQQRKLQP